MSKIEIFNEDCLIVMDRLIEDGTKVNMIFADLPYGNQMKGSSSATTGNKWDVLIPTDVIFDKFRELITDDGAIVMTCTMKYAVDLITHGADLFKYDMIWSKSNGTNPQMANFQPLRTHEIILIFGKGRVSYGGKNPKRPAMKYHPQKTFGHSSYSQKSGKQSNNWKGGLNNVTTTVTDGSRHPKTIQSFEVGKAKGLHPTQKPISMLEFLISSYTDEGDLVFDPTIGSGTAGVAAKQLGRNFIGCEMNETYFAICEDRIANTVEGSSLEKEKTISTEEKEEDNILF